MSNDSNQDQLPLTLVNACANNFSIKDLPEITEENLTELNKIGPIHYAVINNNLEVFSLLIKHGVSINFRSENTPLHYFAISENFNREFLTNIINLGADINAVNDETPLMILCRMKKIDLIKILLENGADLKLKNGQTAFHIASMETESVDILKVLISFGADLQELDKRSAIYYASKKSKGVEIELLINNGLKPTKSHLFKALKYQNSEEAIRLLCSQLDLKNISNVLEYAIKDKVPLSYIKILIENNADLHQKINNFVLSDSNLLHLAMYYYDNPTIADFFIKIGFKPDVQFHY
ncbi:ankyrin repeat-containing protein [Anaeramoeba ignava]|uniref:Ankyrin repeat-containing protein n=1 Tax=Anaeramoeba ignava TaxID=1746090 RepID=A0A9Q0LMY0_ANAIG|nr:ankyrin repeat-containing protein [Anaeramoeba ignava]